MNTYPASRLTLLSLACCAGLAFTQTLQAAINGQLMVADQVPDWAAGDEYRCSGTLITPRVLISSAQCSGATGYFHRKTGQKYYGKTITYPTTRDVLGNVSVFITDTPFGGSPTVDTAPIASYSDEIRELLDGNDELSQGTSLLFFAQDGWGAQNARQMRLVTTYNDLANPIRMDTGDLSSGQSISYGPPLIYRSAQKYRQLEPDRMASSLARFYRVGGPQFDDQDADDAVIFTAGGADWSATIGAPLGNEYGAGLFYGRPNGRVALVGTSFGSLNHVRLSHYWPWVVKTLLNQGLREDAVLLSQKVLGTGNWGENDRAGQVGQIYVYDNPYSGQIEYLRLISVDASNRYWYFPVNQKDNENWEYLGTTLPDKEQATTPFQVWGSGKNGVVQAQAGTIYVYNNPYTREVEYFRLNVSEPYGYFPVNRTGNSQWTYLGTDLPSRKLKYLSQ